MEKAESKINFSIITVSTSRYNDRNAVDESGKVASEIVRSSGNKVVYRRLVPDSNQMIYNEIFRSLQYSSDVVVLIGGTGPTADDLTDKCVETISEKIIEGFGERFRQISFNEVGDKAMIGNAVMGVFSNNVIIAVPGSPSAVRASLKLAINILPHVLSLRRR